MEEPRKAKIILKKSKVRRLILLDIKTHCIATIIKRAWHWCKDKKLSNERE